MKLYRLVSVLTACLLALSAFTAFPLKAGAVTSSDTVYLDGTGGSDESSGASADAGVKTFVKAYEILGTDGGTIKLVSDYPMATASAAAPAHTGLVTVDGSDGSGGTYTVSRTNTGYYRCGGPTKFENIRFETGSNSKYLSIAGSGNSITMGYGITSDYQNSVGVYGGYGNAAGSYTAMVRIEIYSGAYRAVAGGNYYSNGSWTGDAEIHIYGGTINYVYGGNFYTSASAAADQVCGRALIYITGGTVLSSVAIGSHTNTSVITYMTRDSALVYTGGNAKTVRQLGNKAESYIVYGGDISAAAGYEDGVSLTASSACLLNTNAADGYGTVTVSDATADAVDGTNTAHAVNLIPMAAAGGTLSVDENGYSCGDGVNSPSDSLLPAMLMLGEGGGTIEMTGTVPLPVGWVNSAASDWRVFSAPENAAKITITSADTDDMATLYSQPTVTSGQILLNGDIEFSSIIIDGTGRVVFAAQGNHLTMGEGLSMPNAGTAKVSIAGNCLLGALKFGYENFEPHLTFYSGIYDYISAQMRGGSYLADISLNGDALVEILGDMTANNITFGTNAFGDCYGTTTAIIDGVVTCDTNFMPGNNIAAAQSPAVVFYIISGGAKKSDGTYKNIGSTSWLKDLTVYYNAGDADAAGQGAMFEEYSFAASNTDAVKSVSAITDIVGTAIRTSGEQGLRFKAKTPEALRSVTGTMEVAEYGILVKRSSSSSTALLLENATNTENGTVAKGMSYDSAGTVDASWGITDSMIHFASVLTELDSTEYETDFSYRSYVKFANGMTAYSAVFETSIYDVAGAIVEAEYAGVLSDAPSYLQTIIGAHQD